MSNNIVELQRQIFEKNLLLDSFSCKSNIVKKESFQTIQNELDKLLYKYYKTLRDR